MNDIVDKIPSPVKSLWDIENELRSAAQNAIFLRNDEAKKHLEEARRHLENALKAFQSSSNLPPAQS